MSQKKLFSYPEAESKSDMPTKKMSPDAIEASVTRLTTITRKKQTLPPLVEPHVLSHQEIENSLERLYRQSMENRQRQLVVLDRKAHPNLCKEVKLDQTSLENAVNRLYESASNREHQIKQLSKKYLGMNMGKKSIVLDRDAVKECAARMCYGQLGQAKENNAKLYAKYVTSTEPVAKKMCLADIQASADRLYRNEK